VLVLSERFELLGALTRVANDPVLARARDLRWSVATWEARAEIRDWIDHVAPAVSRVLVELAETGAEADTDVDAEAESEAEQDAHAAIADPRAQPG
jgi:hypothetical protein